MTTIDKAASPAAANASAELADAELAAATGGFDDHVHEWFGGHYDAIDYAQCYWGKVGVVGTFRDFAWQLLN